MSHRPILAIAPNGAYKQKSDHPALPLSLQETLQTAIAAQTAGASLLHLHIRDQQQQHSLDPALYRQYIDTIEEHLGDRIIIQITSESAGRFSPQQQIHSIKTVNPACVSIALREILSQASELKPAQALFHWCAEQACRIQFILYSEQDLLDYLSYCHRDVIPDAPHSVLFVLGRYNKHGESSRDDLLPFLKHSTALTIPWMVCAFGASEQATVLYAAQQGGHIRIGFENNLLRNNGEVAENNAQQMQQMVKAVRASGLEPADILSARQQLAIRSA